MKLSFTLLLATLLIGCAQPLSTTSEQASGHHTGDEAADDTTESNETSVDTETDLAPNTTICGCDDTLNLEGSTVATCLQEQLSDCQPASGGYWTDFGTNFVYIPSDQASTQICHFEIYIEEEGFRQKFVCQLEPGATLNEDSLIDPYWPQEPEGATCRFIDSCNVHHPSCESLGPSCLAPY